MSIDLSNKKIPKEAIQALKTIAELLDNMLIGVYLYGSAVMGGLRMNSDVDILVITNQSLSEKTRRNLTNRLMLISGKIGNIKDMRPLEVTVINQKDIVPWHFRMWLTASTGEIRSKDLAAEWAIPQLPDEHATLLNKAREAYLGECVDKWEGMESEVAELVNHMKKSIESSLNIQLPFRIV